MALAAFLDQIPESKRVGGMLDVCFSAGIITNAIVAANATITLINAAVLAAVVTTQQQPLARELALALAKAVRLGFISETTGVTTVADLVALTNATAGYKQGYLG